MPALTFPRSLALTSAIIRVVVLHQCGKNPLHVPIFAPCGFNTIVEGEEFQDF